jgi:hypothetical protein
MSRKPYTWSWETCGHGKRCTVRSADNVVFMFVRVCYGPRNIPPRTAAQTAEQERTAQIICDALNGAP